MPRPWKMPSISFPLQTLLALSYPRSDIRPWLSWIQLHHKQKEILCKYFMKLCKPPMNKMKSLNHWLDQAIAEVPEWLVFGSPDVVADHAVKLILGHHQIVVVYSVAGTFPCTVLNVMGLIQYQDLACQVDLHLVKIEFESKRGKGAEREWLILKLYMWSSSLKNLTHLVALFLQLLFQTVLTLSLIIGSSR